MTTEPVVCEYHRNHGARPNDVWCALTEKDRIARWVGGAHVESEWLPGSDVT